MTYVSLSHASVQPTINLHDSALYGFFIGNILRSKVGLCSSQCWNLGDCWWAFSMEGGMGKLLDPKVWWRWQREVHIFKKYRRQLMHLNVSMLLLMVSGDLCRNWDLSWNQPGGSEIHLLFHVSARITIFSCSWVHFKNWILLLRNFPFSRDARNERSWV